MGIKREVTQVEFISSIDGNTYTGMREDVEHTLAWNGRQVSLYLTEDQFKAIDDQINEWAENETWTTKPVVRASSGGSQRSTPAETNRWLIEQGFKDQDGGGDRQAFVNAFNNKFKNEPGFNKIERVTAKAKAKWVSSK